MIMQDGMGLGQHRHDVTVIDAAGKIVDRWAPEHTRAGPGSDADPPGPPRPPRRAAGGHRARQAAWSWTGCWPPATRSVPIHPNAFHAARPRWGAAGAKSDPGDSYKLADYLRTDGHRLRRLRPLDAATRELQALSRLRDDHVAAKTAASNQLGALLDAHWPGAKRIFSRLGSQIALAFLDATTRPRRQQPGSARPAWPAFCRRHSYRGGRSPAELLERLRAAPAPRSGSPPRCSPSWSAPRSGCCAPCWPPSPTSTGRSAPGCCGHAKARLLAPLPRIGEVNLAQVVAEVGPILDRASNAEHASRRVRRRTRSPEPRARPGRVTFRWAANTQARNALHTFASNSRHSSPWAAKLYADARRRGKHHPHAVRILAAPGSGSCGPAGTTTRPMWSTTTAPNNASPTNAGRGSILRNSYQLDQSQGIASMPASTVHSHCEVIKEANLIKYYRPRRLPTGEEPNLCLPLLRLLCGSTGRTETEKYVSKAHLS